MDIFKIIGIAILGAILCYIVNETKSNIGVVLSIAIGMLIIFMILAKIGGIIDFFIQMSTKYNIDLVFLKVVIKIIGISYVCEFAIDMLTSLGEENIAKKVALAGKVVIVYMAVPIMATLMDTALKLLSI